MATTGEHAISTTAAAAAAAATTTTTTTATATATTTPSTAPRMGENTPPTRAETHLTLSSLPWDLLEGMVFFLAEADLAQFAQVDKTCSAMMHLDEYWRLRFCDAYGQHLNAVQGLTEDFMKVVLGTKSRIKGALVHISDQILRSCEGASSMDNSRERPCNTRTISECLPRTETNLDIQQRLIHQFRCGCARQHPCYWSSAPSPVPDKNEWIDYTMYSGLAVVTSLSIAPYTAFWQPEQPTYNPVEVCFQLYNPKINDGEPYYESPRFRVEGVMKNQVFDLPKPVLTLGGKVMVLLLGMVQRQTLGAEAGETANHYHICLSHLILGGTRMCEYDIDRGDDSVGTTERTRFPLKLNKKTLRAQQCRLLM